MALVTPVISPFSPFPSNIAQTIVFTVGSGGSQVTQNKINIYNNSTNALLYTSTTQTFLLQSIIPSNTLTNSSTAYKVIIQTGDINNNWSIASDAVVFYVLENVVLTFTNITSGQVYNQNITFSATYSQAQLEILQSYIYNLYDNNQSLLQSYPNTYTSTSPLTQLIQGLANNTLYYVEVKTVSVNGQLGTSGLIPFTPFYVAPSLYSTLTTTPNTSTGSIAVDAIILQELGVMDTGTAIYQDGTWIDLTQGGQVSYQNGFAINQSDFLLKLWCKNIPIDIVFLKLYSLNGRIELHMADSMVHAYVYLDGLTAIKPHFVSNVVTIITDQTFMIDMKYQYGLLDLYLTLV